MKKYTYEDGYQAHYVDRVVILPDQVVDNQRLFADNDQSFPARLLDGKIVRVKVDAEATGIYTTGTGDLCVKSR